VKLVHHIDDAFEIVSAGVEEGLQRRMSAFDGKGNRHSIVPVIASPRLSEELLRGVLVLIEVGDKLCLL